MYNTGSGSQLHALTIGGSAFSGCTSLSSVALTENVTRIEAGAFDGCTSLKELELPERVEHLGECMIRGTSVSRIVVPKNVKDVGRNRYGEGPFSGALDLKEVVFEEGMAQIPDYICESGSYTSYIEKVVIPASAKTIGRNAFYNCGGITAIDLKNIEQIGQNAFYGCDKLKSLIIPKGVSEIGGSAFGSCTSLGSVTIS